MSARKKKKAQETPFTLEDLKPARLVVSPEVQKSDGYLSAPDDTQLFYRVWTSEKTDALVVLMHGYAEHGARYEHVAVGLVRAGFSVLAGDARGHGRSTGRRGFVERYDEYVDDFELFIEEARRRFPGRDLFILGHSNGGLISLRHALRKPDGIQGYVVTSPFLGLGMPLPAFKKVAVKALERVAPRLSLPTGLSSEHLTHDPHVNRVYDEDPFVYPTMTVGLFQEIIRAQKDLLRQARQISAPFLFLVAGSDEIVDPSASEAVYHEMGSLDREFELLPDLYHEVLNEPSWDVLMYRIIDWYRKRCRGEKA